MAGEAIAVPNSAGTARPKLKAPRDAADCHMHIYDGGRPQLASRSPVTQAGVAEYRLLQKRTGTTRVVVVQPRNHATDNEVTLNAVSRGQSGTYGGANIIVTSITDAR